MQQNQNKLKKKYNSIKRCKTHTNIRDGKMLLTTVFIEFHLWFVIKKHLQAPDLIIKYHVCGGQRIMEKS